MACITHDIAQRITPLLNTGNTSEDLMEMIRKLPEKELQCGSSEFIQSNSGEQFIRFPIILKGIKNNRIIEMRQGN